MFVTGCHRSGTSLVAGWINAVIPGSTLSESSIPSAPDNPVGFYESKLLVRTNEKLLSLNGCIWSDPPLFPFNWSQPGLSWDWLLSQRKNFAFMSRQHLWVDKDPRLCLTYAAYQHLLLRRIPLVLLIRNPVEVCRSLYFRDGIDPRQGIVIWFLYNLHIASQLQASDLILTYEEVAKRQVDLSLQTAMSTFIHNSSGIQVAPTLLAESLVSLTRPELLRSSSNPCGEYLAETESEQLVCTRHYLRVYVEILSCPISSRHDLFQKSFSQIPDCMLNLLSSLGWQGYSAAWANSHHEELQSRLNAIENSTSWRITGFLRNLADRVRQPRNP